MSKETKTTETTAVSKKTTWLNRIGSAVIGALIAVGSMFGITSGQISEAKAKTATIQKAAGEALEAIKAGDVTVATAKLQEAVATGKEVVASAKEVVEKVKEADAKSVIETAKKAATETLVKDEAKKVEDTAKAVEETKKAEKKAAKEVKKAEAKTADAKTGAKTEAKK